MSTPIPSIPGPGEVNDFHRFDDVDYTPEAHHHTLGSDINQASPGDHVHNGRDSKLLPGYVAKSTVAVTGSRGGNVALTNLLIALEARGVIDDQTVA